MTLQRSQHPMTPAILRMHHWFATHASWGAAGLCAAASILVAPGLAGIFGAALGVTMIAIAAIDSRHFVIPDKLVLPGLALGFLALVTAETTSVVATLVDAAMRAFVIAFLFFALRAGYRWLRGREGIGLGDVKLAAVAGVWLDWMGLAIAVDLAVLSALAVVLLRALRGQPVTAATAIPFGLFFAPAIWIAWFMEVMTTRLAG